MAKIPESVTSGLCTTQTDTDVKGGGNQITYQGTITNDEHAELGVYELDNKIRYIFFYTI